jgi:hypothetical protein
MIYLYTQEVRVEELEVDFADAGDVIRRLEIELCDLRSHLTDAQIRLGTETRQLGCRTLEQLWEKVRGLKECKACSCLKPPSHFSGRQQTKTVGDRTCLLCTVR